MARILLCSSAVRVHDSQTYRKKDVTRERIGRILEVREMLLSYQTGLNLVNAVVVRAILESISGLEPSSDTTELRYLKLVTLKLLSLYFDLLFDAAGVACHQLDLLGTDLHAVGCGGFVEIINLFCQFFFLSC